VLLVTYWLVVTLGSQFSIDLPGLLDDVWGSGALALRGSLSGLALACTWQVVGRVCGAHSVCGSRSARARWHVAPWREAGPPLTGHPLQVVFWTLVWFYVLPIAFGVLVRRGLGPRGVLYGS